MQVIYIAKPTWYNERIYPGYTRFYKEFAAQLAAYHEVRALELPDIWVRDFFPVQNVQTGKLYQPFFDPRYANYTAKFTAEIRRQMYGCFPHAFHCDARIDGGNILLTPDKKYALCLEKGTIFRKSDLAKKMHTEAELKRALGVEEVLWLPHQVGDKIGHIDGYVQFLGNFLMEGAEALYCDLTIGSLLDTSAIKKLREYCYLKNIITYGGDWVRLICRPDKENWLSARGLYVNFLETSRAVFVPQFDLPEDDEVISIMKEYTHKPLVRVDCSAIAEYGGAVHCLTREYDEEKRFVGQSEQVP